MAKGNEPTNRRDGKARLWESPFKKRRRGAFIFIIDIQFSVRIRGKISESPANHTAEGDCDDFKNSKWSRSLGRLCIHDYSSIVHIMDKFKIGRCNGTKIFGKTFKGIIGRGLARGFVKLSVKLMGSSNKLLIDKVDFIARGILKFAQTPGGHPKPASRGRVKTSHDWLVSGGRRGLWPVSISSYEKLYFFLLIDC